MTDTVSENARSYKKPTPQPEPCTRFMSIRDGAAYLGLSASNLWSIVGRGEVAVIKVGGRTVLDRFDLDAFMLARKTKAA